MKPGEKAFIKFVRDKYPEFKNKTDEEVLEARYESLNVEQALFIAGWNAAILYSEPFTNRKATL